MTAVSNTDAQGCAPYLFHDHWRPTGIPGVDPRMELLGVRLRRVIIKVVFAPK